jgi:flagellar biosynthesis/type III secretory pathway protein FliH
MTSRFLAISAALVALGATPALAQPNAWLGSAASYATDDYRASYADARRAAHENGYKDGLKRGERAARDRRPLDLQREGDYRSADGGYNRNYGDRNLYRDSYRSGFARGYREGYTRRHNGTAGYGAFQNGIRDGYSKAVDDIDDRKYPDARKHKWYREGDHDYDKRYGSKDAYKLEYRRGFQQGYERAYRERARF